MGAIQSSETFPWFRLKLTPSVDEVEDEEAREAAAATAAVERSDRASSPPVLTKRP